MEVKLQNTYNPTIFLKKEGDTFYEILDYDSFRVKKVLEITETLSEDYIEAINKIK